MNKYITALLPSLIITNLLFLVFVYKLYNLSCFRSPKVSTERPPVNVREHKFVAALVFIENNSTTLFCQSSIVSVNWLVSADFCGSLIENSVHVFDQVVAIGNEGINHHIQELIYNESEEPNWGILLIRVKTVFKAYYSEEPIPVAKNIYTSQIDTIKTVTRCKVSSRPNNTLQSISVQLLTSRSCKNILFEHFFPMQISTSYINRFLCGSSKTTLPFIDTEIGGPVLYRDLLIGVVGLDISYVEVYVNISMFETWMREIEGTKFEEIISFA